MRMSSPALNVGVFLNVWIQRKSPPRFSHSGGSTKYAKRDSFSVPHVESTSRESWRPYSVSTPPPLGLTWQVVQFAYLWRIISGKAFATDGKRTAPRRSHGVMRIIEFARDSQRS